MKLAPKVLENDAVRLEPCEPGHLADLRAAADDADIWTFMPAGGRGDKFDGFYSYLLGELDAGRWLPHTVIRKEKDNRSVVGMSCFLNIAPHDQRVEIGGTWYHPSAHGTKVNPSCKRLLLQHAFDCGAERVEFKTDARNARSRAALKKLGAQEEGVLRHHMLLPNGTFRDSAYFSILRDEWHRVDTALGARIDA